MLGICVVQSVFAAANEEEGWRWRRGGGGGGGGVGFPLWGEEGGTTEIVLFTSNVWLHLIELQSRCCNSDWPLIDLSSDGERQHD